MTDLKDQQLVGDKREMILNIALSKKNLISYWIISTWYWQKAYYVLNIKEMLDELQMESYCGFITPENKWTQAFLSTLDSSFALIGSTSWLFLFG